MTVRSAFSAHRIERKVGGGPLVKIQVESGSVTMN
jgi:hypothetical protein